MPHLDRESGFRVSYSFSSACWGRRIFVLLVSKTSAGFLIAFAFFSADIPAHLPSKQPSKILSLKFMECRLLDSFFLLQHLSPVSVPESDVLQSGP